MASKALVAASSKPMILSILLNEENYGYQIIQKVKEITGGELDWSDGMLYPVLHRLEKDGYVRSQWKMSQNGRMRKYYKITDSGQEELAVEKNQWIKVHNAFSKLWKPVPVLK